MRGVDAAALWLLLLLSDVASAATTLAIDADPTLPGVQSTRQVALGTTFEVDLYVADVTALQGFQVELELTGGVVLPLDVVDGGFLEPTVFTVQKEIEATAVRFAEL